MGIGTHYAHVYAIFSVGTPPQRVSVIVDTGSHHTAFPCSGCKSCGTHTDPYFDPERSSTLKWLGCSDCVAAAHCMQRKCQVSQSYTEGSSWKANQIKDALYVGGETVISQPASETWLSTSFIFGCQISETGLFRTQKADGIMGMSMNAQTLVPTMNANGQLHKNAFALCFMHGGGSMTLGG
ncbi:aspartic peptidase domain-containing protein, partial [Pelagophyceae sp. CCMP2097]